MYEMTAAEGELATRLVLALKADDEPAAGAVVREAATRLPLGIVSLALASADLLGDEWVNRWGDGWQDGAIHAANALSVEDAVNGLDEPPAEPPHDPSDDDPDA